MTDLPEYAKEAAFWYKQALARLKDSDSEKAAEYLRNAIVKVYLYRKSRNLQ